MTTVRHVQAVLDAMTGERVRVRARGRVVERVRLDRPHVADDSTTGTAWAVTVDGVLRGCIARRRNVHARGGPLAPGWRVFTLMPPLRHYGTRHYHKPHERRVGVPTVAAAVGVLLDLLDKGEAPAPDEVTTGLQAQDAANDARDAASAQARADRIAREAADAAQAERDRDDIAEALASIRDRLGTQLTNFELHGLGLALAHFPPK